MAVGLTWKRSGSGQALVGFLGAGQSAGKAQARVKSLTGRQQLQNARVQVPRGAGGREVAADDAWGQVSTFGLEKAKASNSRGAWL